MAVTTTIYDGTANTITITTAGLTDGSFRQSASFDNNPVSTPDKFVDAIIGGSIQVGTSPTAGDVINIFAYATFDNGTTFTAGASGSDAAYTADGEEGLFFRIETIAVDGTSDQDYVWGPKSLAQVFGGTLPELFGIVINNETGATLNATGTNNIVKFTGVKYDTT